MGIGVLFLLLQTILAIFFPKFFFFTYLLYISSFLGFLPRDIFAGGNEIGLFYHSMLMLVVFGIYFKRINDLPEYIKILLWLIIVLYIYGIIAPVITGLSSVKQSIIASREFSTLFFIHFLFVNRKSLSFILIYRYLSFFGYYFLIILSLFVLFTYIPPEYIKGENQIEYNYPALLSLFIFIKTGLSNTFRKKLFTFFLIIVWTIGMYYEEHSAIMITTSLGSIFILFKFPLIKFTKNFKWLFTGILLLILVLLILPTEKYLSKLSETSSFKARAIYNVERFELLSQKPLQGYGFLHKSASNLGNSVFTESLSFIDSGYVDLLGKFGFIGMVMYLLLLTISFFKRKCDLVLTSIKIFFLQFFLVNITWSVFSFAMGIIPLSLAIILFYNYKFEI